MAVDGDRVGAALAEPVRVVGAALVRGSRLLACRRTEPPRLAGCWEFPGGKVEPGESDSQALRREIEEELGLAVTVGARLGGDVLLDNGSEVIAVLRVFWCTARGDGRPRLVDHDDVRWLSAAELSSVPWLEADLGLVELARVGLAGPG